MAETRLPHILLRDKPENSIFTSTLSNPKKPNIPLRQRDLHSKFLKSRLEQAWYSAENERAVAHIERNGVYIEFKSDPGADLVIKSLEDLKSKKVRLLNVRTEKEIVPDITTDESKEVVTTYATVYVANEKKGHFLKKIEEYAKKENQKGIPKNSNLINSIADIRKALAIESFWQDDPSLIPDDSPQWCEIWLSSDAVEVISRFENLLKQLNLPSKTGVIRFPERAVKVVFVNVEQLSQISMLSDDIAEYRHAKTTAEFWTELQNKEQTQWVQNLLNRSRYQNTNDISVCLLDTGVNNGHPLISPVLSDIDCQAVNSSWGTHDHDKHGTLMAGIAAYGDLVKALMDDGPIDINHCLESVKILPKEGSNPTELWGDITSQGVSLAEIQAPERKRIFCMAVAADDTRDRGRPSSWSGQLDQIIAGVDDDNRRLMIVSAGNSDPGYRNEYPDAQITDSIHDPAQSWNALTVGAFTELDTIQDMTYEGYTPIAPKGGLSPFSTTSCTWEDKWPIKPEIVMEGGNLACDENGFASECEDLSLLSTFFDPQTKHFFPFSMTSAACSQAARMAAHIQSQYPDFWPETIRALMVHSADWPDALWEQFSGNGSKTDIKKLLRVCGYGVPDLERALYSASNSLTLIAQAVLQPFDKKRDDEGKTKSGHRTKDMHLYELPWPKEVLQGLPEGTDVEMRVTLSYFIEPGPGEIGWKDRYRYASHGLRFDLKSPTESKDQFIKRINKAARDEEEGHPGTQSPKDYWKIGQARDRGSIHSDIWWNGTASELADSNIISISPRIGWWRERAHLGRWDRSTRYSLVVSITTPEEIVDLYTPVAIQVGIPAVTTPIEVTI